MKNYIFGYPDLYVYQNDDLFKMSLDSVLLSNFVTLKKSGLILDIGTGNAPIPLMLSKRTNAKITGIEIQESSYALAVDNVLYNKLESRINIINADAKELNLKNNFYDVIVCNPPYYKSNMKIANNLSKKIARSEVLLSLEDIFKISRKALKDKGNVAIVNKPNRVCDIISISKKLLKNKGNLAIVIRPDRLIEIIELMRKNNIEPKRIKFIYPKLGKESNIMLIEGIKNGKPGLKVLDPLYVYQNNEYSKDLLNYVR